MHEFIQTNGHTQLLIPLRVTPYSHKAVPTVTGSAFSEEAGTVLYGHYNMEYLLPGGDRLRLISNHNKKTVQLLLFTHDPVLIKNMPGERIASLVADAIRTVDEYRTRAKSYHQPLTSDQLKKVALANHCIEQLSNLLPVEKALTIADYKGHETLRRNVLDIIEQCRDGNRFIANNPVVSEGSFGYLLYDAHKAAQNYQFNRLYCVSSEDQMNFCETSTHQNKDKPCFVWDSELHIGHNNSSLDNALRIICEYYHLNPAEDLCDVPANRFEKFERFFLRLARDGQDWINHLTIKTKPTHKTDIHTREDGLSITKITPYYKLKGITQASYLSLSDMVTELTHHPIEAIDASGSKDAKNKLSQLDNGNWAMIPGKQYILVKHENNLFKLKYFIHEGSFYPMPDGQDLYDLSQVSKRHLYLPERVRLRMYAFVSRIPTFFQNFYYSLSQFVVHDLFEEFMHHIHSNHKVSEAAAPITAAPQPHQSLHDALVHHGLLNNGETLKEFIKEHILNSPYVIARAKHPPSPPAYENPLHRIIHVIRHIGAFFVDTSERNPIIGTLATAAYFYGGGAVLAPKALEALLTKLHLQGLIAGIEPVQRLGRWMSHGQISEAISSSVTLWQGVVVGGNLDKFFVEAIGLLKEDPAEIAIITALALSLGYGLTKAIPSLQKEMGKFALPNYAALGAKSGAALYDTIMHPGEDWLLGTCKWMCRGVITFGKVLIAPFVEGAYYGFQEGFISGWKKSAWLVIHTSKQLIAALSDFIFILLTIPLLEMSAMLLHVPFRGVTNFFRKLLSSLGNLKIIGDTLIHYGKQPSSDFITEFQLSPLYGYDSPLGQFSQQYHANLCLNVLNCIYLPLAQTIKNFVLLPLLDFLSFTVRLTLTCLSPLMHYSAYGVGKAVYVLGEVSDNSLGQLCTLLAFGITLVANWIDNQAAVLKQGLLSAIEVKRAQLYHWAFAEEDWMLHSEDRDEDYYYSHPGRYEKIPHPDSHCLLKTLLNTDEDLNLPVSDTEVADYGGLFKSNSGELDFKLSSSTMEYNV